MSALRPPASRARSLRRRPAERGALLLDLLFGIVVLVVALLAQARTLVGGARLTQVEATRTQALLVVAQVAERLRAEPDFGSLYATLRVLEEASGSAGALPLADGRWAHPASTYVEGYDVLPAIGGFWLRLEVPSAPLASDPLGPVALREDVAELRFGLPADLNLDGTIDGEARDGDYAVLPVDVTCAWRGADGAIETYRFSLWLRGGP